MQFYLPGILVAIFATFAFSRHFETRSPFWPEAEQYDKRNEWEGDAEKSLGSFYDPEQDEKEAEIAREVEDRFDRAIQEDFLKNHNQKRFLFGQDKREWSDDEDENENEWEPEKRHFPNEFEEIARRLVNKAQLKKLRGQ